MTFGLETERVHILEGRDRRRDKREGKTHKKGRRKNTNRKGKQKTNNMNKPHAHIHSAKINK